MILVRATRAILFSLVATGMSACVLAVSTNGLSGPDVDPAQPTTDSSAADAASESDAGQSDGDAGDAKTFPPGASVWPVNGHAYALVIDTFGVAWPQARVRAEQAGGHLATIGSADENAFVVALIEPHRGDAFVGGGVGAWLGGWQPDPASAVEPGGGWAWVDGTPWQFTAWQANQPDNGGTTEHFLDFYGNPFRWNDDSANGFSKPIISYVVEFE
jgi:hypothetical protein